MTAAMPGPRTTGHDQIVLLDGARTPVGAFGGAFAGTPAHELGAVAVRAALERSGVPFSDVDEVLMGCIGQVALTPTTPDE